MKDQYLRRDYLLPVKMVSSDQYLSRSKSRLFLTKLKSYLSDMFSVGCVSIDHFGGYVKIRNQFSINVTETVKAKLFFERESQSQIVVIKAFNTNNGVFNAS